jgi:hypothetical protein
MARTAKEIPVHERGWVELAHAPQIEWAPLPAAGWPVGVQARVLSRDATDGALTAVVRLPEGYRRPLGHHTAGVEVLIISGTLRLGDGVHGLGWYGYLPAGVTSSAWTAESEVELLLCARTGSPDFRPEPGPVAGHDGAITIDTTTVDWTAGTRPGIAPGISHKLLRADPETGEFAFLGGVVPAWRSPFREFHTAIEEIYCISGDITLGNSGRMDAGSYLWRPPFITHGPFYSRTGAVLFGWVPSLLVNHFPDDPRRTIEENIAEYESKQRAAAAGGN